MDFSLSARSFVLALLPAVAVVAPAGSQVPGEAPLAIRGVTVIDATGAAPRTGATVVIREGRIEAVGPDGAVAIPVDARVVEGEGRFLVPGLWDMHAHLSKARDPALPLLVANGVLGVRDTGGDMPELQRWRAEIRSGERVGPRIVMAGPYLESPANVLRVLMAGTVEPEERTRIPVADPAGARAVVDSIAAGGADFVKVRTWADLEAFRAIADAAADHGLPLAAHTFGLPPELLRKGAVSSIEHFYPVPEGWTEQQRLAFYRDLAERGTVVVPTIVNVHESLFVPDTAAAKIVADTAGRIDPRRPYVSAYLLADWEEQLEERSPQAVAGWRSFYPTVLQGWREMHRAGMRLLPGSDLAVLLVHPGSSLHRDLELLVDEVGLTPMEALESATRLAAEFVGLGDSVGTIEPGKAADLVLLDADPLAEISNTRRIAAVVQRGRLHTRADLDRLRESALEMPAIGENDWPAPPPGPALREARAIEEAIDAADSAGKIATALERFRAMEETDRLPGGREALGARVEAAVNRAGYRLLGAERVDEAIAVLEFNTAAFPEAFNTWDSLAEAYLTAGDRARAIRYYRKSLELNPDNDNAREQLEKLGAGPGSER